ncbi:MAG TPA: Plug domain-containing protein [Puia sp.]|nr:Plug domain-containing protein [Puia sp.]
MHLRQIFPFGFFVISVFFSNGQAEKVSLDALAGKFVKEIRANERERILLLTDKKFYAAGENLWLKAWCLGTVTNKVISRSKNLYVDLVDDHDSAISQLLFNNADNKTAGRILIPESLKEGYYWLRAYTINILKEDSTGIFVKPIYVLNSAKSDPRSVNSRLFGNSYAASDSIARVNFYPEGGSIVSGTTARVAFFAHNGAGMPKDVSGFVLDTRNDTVAKFRSTYSGRGEFTFDAFSPRKYFAHVLINGGQNTVYSLPSLDPFAYQLSVIKETENEFQVRVSLGDSLYKKGKTTYILGINRDSICFAANGADMYETGVPKSNFPKGMSTLFLFSDDGRIVSERHIYVNASPSMVKFEASTDKAKYVPREKVKLNINFSDQGHQHALALFTIAAVDERVAETKPATEGEQDPILNLPESSENIGVTDIDLVALTEKNLYPGWQFDNPGSLATRNAVDDDSSILDIRGRIVNMKNEPVKNHIVNLISKDNSLFRIDTTDNDGRFKMSLTDYYDGAQFVLKLTNLKGHGESGRVLIDKMEFPQFPTPKALKAALAQADITAIRNFKAHMLEDTSFYGKQNDLLTPVTIKGEKNNTANYDKSKRVSPFSYIITSDNLNNGDRNAVLNVIQNVPGFNSGISTFSVAAETLSGGGYMVSSEGVQPLVVLDGVPLSLSGDVKTFLQNIDETNIDFIEVLKGPLAATYGLQGSGGVILINTTNSKNQATQMSDQGITTIFPKGYFKNVSFLLPDYEKKDLKKSSNADKRTTLFWNANVLTDKNGIASQTFFTGDNPGIYSIDIVGMLEDGSLISSRVKIRND